MGKLVIRRVAVNTVSIKYDWLFYVCMIYIYLPILIFCSGWLNIFFALISLGACFFCFYRVVKEKAVSQKAFSVDLVVLIFAILLFAWIGYYAGYGRFVEQAGDWKKHNAILYDLVNRNWPVLYTNGKEHSMLTYYIGQYMVAALVGKVTHSTRIAEIVLYIWNMIGLVLVLFNLLYFTKAKTFFEQMLYVLMIPFFSIPLWISEVVLKIVSSFNTIGNSQWFYFGDGILIQYSNNYTLLRWVFVQVIPIWLIVIVFLIHRDKIRCFALLLLPAIFFGTLTFLGIIPLAAGILIEELYKQKKLMPLLEQIFSLENVFIGLSVGSVFFFYFLGNVTGEKPSDIGFALMPYTSSTFIVYLTFIGINIIPYAVILYKKYSKDSIFYVTIISLVILPLFKMGQWNDLTMRASIPGLFILMIYVLHNLIDIIKNFDNKLNKKVALIFTAVFLMVGMYYPLMELSESVQTEDFGTLGDIGWSTLEDFANRSQDDIAEDLKYNYYSYDIDKNIFCRYFMKK